MRRMTFMVMALALVLGFTQCKKEQTPANNETEGVFITLDVNGGNNSKVIVTPGYENPETHQVYAKVDFEDDDVIYVGYNGAYVGTLTYGGEEGHKKFSGSVDIESYDCQKPLHFYFLGGLGFNPTIDETNNTATVNISDQTTKYPVISYAPSKQAFTGAGSYSAKLQNKVSIMKFNVTTPSTAAICITGMNNEVTVNFNPETEDERFTYGMNAEDGGLIKMKGQAGEGEKTYWAIVLPQEELTTTGDAYSEDHSYTGTRPAIHAIESNKYYHEGGDVINMTVNTHNGLFSVSSTKQVYFSQGNLQATTTDNGSTWIWSFATNQYDYVGDAVANTAINGNGTVSTNGTVDLFGWSTAATVNGIHNSMSEDDYSGDFFDWGKNAIANGGNTANSGWRTLTNDEWVYLFDTRTDAASKKGLGKVNSVNGIILLPDEWTLPSGLTFTPFTPNSSWANDYTTEQWAQMEAGGAVFLPAAGNRQSTSLYKVGDCGYYWSSTADGSTQSYIMFFAKGFVNPQTSADRYLGRCVRLVHDNN